MHRLRKSSQNGEVSVQGIGDSSINISAHGQLHSRAYCANVPIWKLSHISYSHVSQLQGLIPGTSVKPDCISDHMHSVLLYHFG